MSISKERLKSIYEKTCLLRLTGVSLGVGHQTVVIFSPETANVSSFLSFIHRKLPSFSHSLILPVLVLVDNLSPSQPENLCKHKLDFTAQKLYICFMRAITRSIIRDLYCYKDSGNVMFLNMKPPQKV